MNGGMHSESVEVRLARLEEQLQGMRGDIKSLSERIAEKFGAFNSQMSAQVDSSVRQGSRIGACEGYIQQIQAERRVLAGVMAVVGAVFGFVGSIILKLIGGQ